jgi:hypothetical protein
MEENEILAGDEDGNESMRTFSKKGTLIEKMNGSTSRRDFENLS